MTTIYESPLEHSSSPDGCREDCLACEDERLHEVAETAKLAPIALFSTAHGSIRDLFDPKRNLFESVTGKDRAVLAETIAKRFNSHDALLAASNDLLALCRGGTGNALQIMERAESAIRKATP